MWPWSKISLLKGLAGHHAARAEAEGRRAELFRAECALRMASLRGAHRGIWRLRQKVKRQEEDIGLLRLALGQLVANIDLVPHRDSTNLTLGPGSPAYDQAKEALKECRSKYIVWEEPLPGIREDGSAVTCTRRVYVTEHDAACLARAMYTSDNREWRGLTHEHLVTDAIVENWASRVEVQRLP